MQLAESVPMIDYSEMLGVFPALHVCGNTSPRLQYAIAFLFVQIYQTIRAQRETVSGVRDTCGRSEDIPLTYHFPKNDTLSQLH